MLTRWRVFKTTPFDKNTDTLGKSLVSWIFFMVFVDPREKSLRISSISLRHTGGLKAALFLSNELRSTLSVG